MMLAWCPVQGGRQNRLAKFIYVSGNPSATLSTQEVLKDSAATKTSIDSAGFCGFKPSDYGKSVSFVAK